MIKDIIFENRKKYLMAVGIMLLVLLTCVVLQCVISYQKKENNRSAMQVLDQITYEDAQKEEEQELLGQVVSVLFLSDHVRGKLYRALAEICYMTGEDMEYNNYVSNALFYMEKSQNYEAVVEIYIEYIGRLYANGCYDAAKNLLEYVNEIKDVSSMEKTTQVAYYLSYADVEEMSGELENAKKHIESAEILLQELTEDSDRNLLQAKSKLLQSRLAILQGDFETAESLLAESSEYGNADNIGKDLFVVCDYQIPYYELMTKILIHHGNYEEALENADKYITHCSAYNFRIMKLKMLQYIVAEFPMDASADAEYYHLLEIEISADTLDEFAGQYGTFLLADIENIQGKLADKQDAYHDLQRFIAECILVFFILITGICGLFTFISYMNKDGLTKLSSRKVYERERYILEKKKMPHYLLMLDIDDFKKVNDTFGHHTGDVVLRDIADILRQHTNVNVTAYRYGGEEMCMLFRNASRKQVAQTAEEIRQTVWKTLSTDEMTITISGGVGVSEHGENCFQSADHCLYYSKEHGKNQISWKM